MQATCVGAAGEAAAAVARSERAPERRWYRPGLAADPERPVGALEQRNQRRVATEPPHRFQRERRAVLEGSDSSGIAGQRRRVDMHDDLVAVTAAPLGIRGQGGVSDREQRLNPRRAPNSRRRFRGTAFRHLGRRCLFPGGLPEPLPRDLERLQKQRTILRRKPAAEDERAIRRPGPGQPLRLLHPTRERRRRRDAPPTAPAPTDPPSAPRRARAAHPRSPARSPASTHAPSRTRAHPARTPPGSTANHPTPAPPAHAHAQYGYRGHTATPANANNHPSPANPTASRTPPTAPASEPSPPTDATTASPAHPPTPPTDAHPDRTCPKQTLPHQRT